MVMGSGRLTEHSLGTIDNMNLEITHNGKQLKLNRDEVLQGIFTERNWMGGAKGYYVFFKQDDGEGLEMIGLEGFSPYRGISAEEAYIMVHEGVTMRGVKSLVTKAGGKGVSRKLMIFIIIFVVIIAVVYLNSIGGI